MSFAQTAFCDIALLFTSQLSHAGFVIETLSLGDFTLAGDDSAFVAYNNPDNLPIIGFTVSFDFDTTADQFAWASDLRITFEGLGFNIGGFPAGGATFDWDFQGSGSSDSGFYEQLSTANAFAGGPLAKGDLSGFTLLNSFSFNGPVSWNNVSINLLSDPPTPSGAAVPAPPTLLTALVAVPLLGWYRRRRVSAESN